MTPGRLQRGIIIVPSALTIANLFFGMWAMISAAEGDFARAAWLIVFAGITDTLDGRVARAYCPDFNGGLCAHLLADQATTGVDRIIQMRR